MSPIVVESDAWDSDIQGSLLAWVYPDGATVGEGQIVAEVMVEKLQVEVAAPASGVLRHGAPEGELLSRGQCIGSIESG